MPKTGDMVRISNQGRLFQVDKVLSQNLMSNEGLWSLECEEANMLVRNMKVFFEMGAGFSD